MKVIQTGIDWKLISFDGHGYEVHCLVNSIWAPFTAFTAANDEEALNKTVDILACIDEKRGSL